MSTLPGHYTILSFVGGGIRGLLSATILQRLYDANKALLDETRMFAGCSTGAIISSELLGHKTPKDLIDMFTGDELNFYNAMNPDPRTPAYSIDKVLGSQKAIHFDTKIADARKDVLLVSFNVGQVEPDRDNKMMPTPWKPMMFTNMLGSDRDRLDGLDGNGDTPIAVAATSSGAMPGQLGSIDGNVDGAFFNHDPTVAAIALAVRSGYALDQIAAITIGTGYMPYWLQSDTHDWGAQQWMEGDGNPFDNITPFLMNQKRSSPVLDLSLNGTSSELMPHIAKMLLGDRYVNINPRLPCFIPENSTNTQAISLLQRHGQTVDITDALALIENYWSKNVVTRGTTSRLVAKSPAAATPKAATPPKASQTTPVKGALFFIRHKGSIVRVLDVKDASYQAGAQVIAYSKKSMADPDVKNQLWEFVPSVEAPGWWYLKTAMGTNFVMTLAGDDTGAASKVTVQARQDDIRDRQLWNLVSTEELGYFFIQNKYQASDVPIVNTDSYVPTVIGVEIDHTEDCYGVALDYQKDTPMAFCFLPPTNEG
jgi:patatin-like phospholipase/acyl hydrolase